MKYYETIKSSTEFIFCLLLLILAVPICILVCIAIYLELHVNPIYTQNRVGLNGRIFKIYKLRSMYIDAEKDGAKWASENDERITKVGRIIRKTRIDELPQLVNILKRDMSIIGPRPERPELIKDFIKYIPDFNDRLLVKPGITGWAQVNGGYSLTPKEKLEFDKYYIRNRGFKLDLLIIVKTIIVIFTRNGAR
ncbi:MAG: sugar transferase [Gemella haemolysans]|uniref:sugar transferase n=1 Tax=Gemella haemolysans TaxID=1379 RepID=UPI000AADB7B9|nr:sugar transferase [Gemella haemolysans]MDU6572688.1 sugar transferase [Gemella haemolysans]PMC48789.1 capsular biosynthesis protein [Streptococcus sp. UMB1385]